MGLFSFDFKTITEGKSFILYLSIKDSSELLTIPKNNFYSKVIDNPLNIVGVPVLSVKSKTLGTDTASFIKVSILLEVTSITFYYKYPAA